MITLEGEDRSVFKQAALRLATTNLLQFLAILPLIIPTIDVSSLYQQSLPIQGGLLILLLVDLYITYRFLVVLRSAVRKPDNPLLLYGYLLASFILRLFVVYNLRFGATLLSDDLILLVVVSFLFGMNLYSITQGVEFQHDEKLKLLIYTNFFSITAFFGDAPLLIFTGIKVLLPLPASFIYFVLAYDFGRLEPAIEEIDIDSNGDEATISS